MKSWSISSPKNKQIFLQRYEEWNEIYLGLFFLVIELLHKGPALPWTFTLKFTDITEGH